MTFTTLFPNGEQPGHGIFVEARLRHLLASSQVAARVVAPVPWFPSGNAIFGSYSRFARVQEAETRSAIPVYHPRYLVIPKLGMTVAPWLLYRGAIRTVADLLASGAGFDAIDAHYFYPDGVAAALIARRLRKPLVITARGTDVNLITQYALPRRMILWAARQAAATITVSAALKARLVALGADGDRIQVLRNGVDLDLFKPCDREAARAHLGLMGQGPVLASVGNLVELKGHDIVLEALARMPAARLLIAGAGPLRPALERRAAELGVADRATFLGRVAQDELPRLYSASDALVLASSREGWPNVLLEAMACGTPVVASDISGMSEIVSAPAAGRLVPERTGAAFAAAIAALLAEPPGRAATRAYASNFSWDATTAGQLALFRRLAA